MSMQSTASQKLRILRGFTLVEVVMTLIIAAMLLTTASYYLYSILNVYERTRKNPAFDEHVQNVTLFLSNALLQGQDKNYIHEVTIEKKESNPSKPNNKTSTEKTKSVKDEKSSSEYPTVAWKQLPEASSYDIYFLAFTFYTPSPLLSLPNFPNYPTIAYLELVPEKGLYLIWHISKSYYKDDPLPVYRILISSYAKRLEYFYYDKGKEEWKPTTENPDDEDDAKTIPGMIRIIFSDGSSEAVGTVLLNKEFTLEEFL